MLDSSYGLYERKYPDFKRLISKYKKCEDEKNKYIKMIISSRFINNKSFSFR